MYFYIDNRGKCSTMKSIASANHSLKIMNIFDKKNHNKQTHKNQISVQRKRHTNNENNFDFSFLVFKKDRNIQK
jgi:hypothetical protein